MHGVRGQRDDRSVLTAEPLTRANGGRGGEAIHLWHLHIHENHVEWFSGMCLDRRPAVVDHVYGVVRLFENADREPLIDAIVLREEDARPRFPVTARALPCVSRRGVRGRLQPALADTRFRCPLERAENRIQQIRLANGFRQVVGDPQLAAA